MRERSREAERGAIDVDIPAERAKIATANSLSDHHKKLYHDDQMQ